MHLTESTIPSKTGPEKPWDITITPHLGWFHFPLQEIWQYRGLLLVLVYRDYKALYKQTIFGSAWHVVQPLMQTALFTLVFSNIAKISTDGTPPFLFFYAGLICWTYFQNCVTQTANTFSANAYIFQKIYFPRLIVPLSQIVGNLFGFLMNFITFLLFYLYFIIRGAPIFPSWWILAIPLLLLQMAAMGLGVGCLVSSVTTRWRDLAMLVPTAMQIWMYISCIAYPLSQIPPEHRVWFLWNPIVPIVEGVRYAFMGRGVVELWQIGAGAVLSVVLLLAGFAIFHRVEKNSMDSV